MDELTHLSLFSGIGGIDLAAEWAGFKTIGQVENNKYAIQVLRKRFGKRISRWADIRDLSAEDFRRRTGIERPTLITGGFPCQPFSCAGRRKGKADDRYLWPEMLRVVRELRSPWVVGENVSGIIALELDSCIADLEGEGYSVRTFLIPACGVGAIHRRDRIFIVANSPSARTGVDQSDTSGQGRESPGTLEPEMVRCGNGSTNAEGTDPGNAIIANDQCTRRGRIYPSGRGVSENAGVLCTTATFMGDSNSSGRGTGSNNIGTGSVPQAEVGAVEEGCGNGNRRVVRAEQGSSNRSFIPNPQFVAKRTKCGEGSCRNVDNQYEVGREMGDKSGNLCTPQPKPLFSPTRRASQYEQRGGETTWWTIEPDVGRVAYGVPARVDRLRCLGNAVVPQQVYPILAGIAQIEKCLHLR